MPRQTDCICVNLRRAARVMTQLYDAALAPSGLKVTQFSLLRAVQRNEPAAITLLADELDLDRTTLARNLALLERDRLITLAAGSDRRVSEARLTAKGRAAVGKALPLWEKTQVELRRKLPAGRIEELRAIAAEAVAIGQAQD